MEQARQETQPPAPAAAEGPVHPGRGRDRVIKLVFVLITLVVVALLYWFQRRGLSLPDWGTDLAAGLTQAEAENRSVVVLFANAPPGEQERWLKNNILSKPENEGALRDGRFIKVVLNIGNVATSDLARHYKITELPTLLLLGPDGVEKNRRPCHSRRIGEVEFRTGFLDCSQVVPPPAAGGT
jgi:hypothetical protein